MTKPKKSKLEKFKLGSYYEDTPNSQPISRRYLRLDKLKKRVKR